MPKFSPNGFEYITKTPIRDAMNKLPSLELDNRLTGVTVETQHHGCSNTECHALIRKSTMKNRFVTIKLNLTFKVTDDGTQVSGYSKIDWLSYWFIAIIDLGIAIAMISAPYNILENGWNLAIIAMLIFATLFFIWVGFFERNHMIEEVYNIV